MNKTIFFIIFKIDDSNFSTYYNMQSFQKDYKSYQPILKHF
jgi:hypothetical protein